jgi:hypothetical protein
VPFAQVSEKIFNLEEGHKIRNEIGVQGRDRRGTRSVVPLSISLQTVLGEENKYKMIVSVLKRADR